MGDNQSSVRFVAGRIYATSVLPRFAIATRSFVRCVEAGRERRKPGGGELNARCCFSTFVVSASFDLINLEKGGKAQGAYVSCSDAPQARIAPSINIDPFMTPYVHILRQVRSAWLAKRHCWQWDTAGVGTVP